MKYKLIKLSYSAYLLTDKIYAAHIGYGHYAAPWPSNDSVSVILSSTVYVRTPNISTLMHRTSWKKVSPH